MSNLNEYSYFEKLSQLVTQLQDEKQEKELFVKELSDVTQSTVTNPDNGLILDVVLHFGWNSGSGSFNIDLDYIGLKIAIENKLKGTVIDLVHPQLATNYARNSFFPNMLLNKLSELATNKIALTPHSVSFDCICLLVDISGFTRLSGQYCAKGKDGIDGLQRATNGYMGTLVDIIYDHGGDIVKFAGDAIICTFTTSDSHLQYDGLVSLRNANHMVSSPHHNSQSLSAQQSAAKNSANKVALLLEAMQCAMKLREQVSPDQLTVHVAISCGDMSFGMLGGYGNRWDCLISGECLFQLSQCLDDAPSRHVAMTQQCYELLAKHGNSKNQSKKQNKMDTTAADETGNADNQALDNKTDAENSVASSIAPDSTATENEYLSAFHLEQVQSGNYLIHAMLRPLDSTTRKKKPRRHDSVVKFSTDNDTSLLVEQFMPMPIIQALNNKDFELLAELREVTTIFMKWDGYDSHTHRDLLSLQGYFYTAQEILSKAGGFIRQFLVDDKGCVLIAVWGVPTASFIDNTMRALSSAVLIRDAFLRSDMKCSFGITTGNVYCGCVGSTLRREYAVIGDVVNLSARLMSKAKGGVYIDENTWKRLPPHVTSSMLTRLEPIMVKGKDTPIVIFSYTSSDLLKFHNAKIQDYDIRASCKSVLVAHLDFVRDENKHEKRQENSGHFFNFHSTLSSGAHSSAQSNIRGSLSDSLQGSSIHSNGNNNDNSNSNGNGNLGASNNNHSADTLHLTYSSPENSTYLPGHTQKTDNMFYSLHTIMSKSNSTDERDSPAVHNNNNRNSISIAKESRSSFTGLTSTAVNDNLIKYVLIEGKVGSGKATTMRWFLQQTLQYNIPTISVSLSNRDTHIEYKVLSKIFRLLVTAQTFDNMEQQRLLVSFILKELYGTDREKAEQIAFPAMKLAFGITCSINYTTGISECNFKRLPPKLMLEVVFEVFEFLLRGQHKIIIIERIHFADEASLKAINCLRKIQAKCVVLMTTVSYEDYLYEYELHSLANMSYSIDALSYQSTMSFRNMLLLSKQTTLIVLDNFTLSELNTMLDDNTQLAKLVYQLSGGNPFWVGEIVAFIRTKGSESFMDAMTIVEEKGNTADRRVSGVGLKENSPRRAESTGQMYMSPKHSPVPDNRSFSEKPTAHFGNERIESTNNNSTIINSSSNNNSYNNSHNNSNNNSNNNSTYVPSDAMTEHDKSRLEMFIVCRFENLSLTDQKILRIACIVGFHFSRYVLYGVLSIALKGEMYGALTSLIKTNWISLRSADSSEYTFSHRLVYDTIYNLTPLSSRANTHALVAEYVQEMAVNDQRHYLMLAHHYSFCNVQKSFENYMRAVVYNIKESNSDDSNVEDCLYSCRSCVPYCSTAYDIQMIIEVLLELKAKMYVILSRQQQDDEPNNELSERIETLSLAGVGQSSKSISAAFNAVTAVETKKKRTIAGCIVRLLCCQCLPFCRGKVQPDDAMELLGDIDDNESVSAMSVSTAAQLYTAKAIQYMVNSILALEKELVEVKKQFLNSSHKGAATEWQLALLSSLRRSTWGKMSNINVNELRSMPSSSFKQSNDNSFVNRSVSTRNNNNSSKVQNNSNHIKSNASFARLLSQRVSRVREDKFSAHSINSNTSSQPKSKSIKMRVSKKHNSVNIAK